MPSKAAARNRASPRRRRVDVHTRAAEDKLKFLLGTRVRIVRRGTAAASRSISDSEEELIRIFDHVNEDRAAGRMGRVGRTGRQADPQSSGDPRDSA